MNKTILYTVYRICVFFLPAFVALDTNAQISSTADYETYISFQPDTNQVSVYVFYSPPGKTVFGDLKAEINPDSIYNFEWFQYNTTTDSFDISLLSQSGVTSSLLDNLSGGGYSVHIFNGTDTDTTIFSWVYIDKLVAKVINKDLNDNLTTFSYSCDRLTLEGVVTIDTFYCYHTSGKDSVRLENGFTFLWTSDNKDLKIPNAARILAPNTTYLPPYRDTWYILTAIDSFGLTDVDSVYYESIQVKSQFRFQIYDPNKDKEEFVDAVPPAEGDAPLRVKFINESVNGFSYEWIFSDSLRSGFFANESTSDSLYQPEYLYKFPNDKGYFPELVGTSEAGCIDTFRFDLVSPPPIKVLPSTLEVPNVFTPDGNNTHDYFKVKFKSMKEFSIRIYDREGKLVYKAEVSDMYTWDGWNGNVLDSDRQASSGPYFYVIEATGWDKKFYHKGIYRGVVYLFRDVQ